MSDLRFWFDPVCPFAWLTSTWVRHVAAQRAYDVQWQFISLRLLNADIDYDAHFPPEYEQGHTAGLHLLRMCAKTRAEHGQKAVGRLYEALGTAVFETRPLEEVMSEAEALPGQALAVAGLPAELAAAVHDESWDELIGRETQEALSLTGRDVGTPIIQVDPPDGPGFFGPVISRRPSDEDALALWDHVVALARFDGFAELKRSLREEPQLRALGVAAGSVGRTQDWEAGRRAPERAD